MGSGFTPSGTEGQIQRTCVAMLGSCGTGDAPWPVCPHGGLRLASRQAAGQLSREVGMVSEAPPWALVYRFRSTLGKGPPSLWLHPRCLESCLCCAPTASVFRALVTPPVKWEDAYSILPGTSQCWCSEGACLEEDTCGRGLPRGGWDSKDQEGVPAQLGCSSPLENVPPLLAT